MKVLNNGVEYEVEKSETEYCWYVKKSHGPSKYTVVYGNPNWNGASCSCPQGKYKHANFCKHYEMVGMILGNTAGPQVPNGWAYAVEKLPEPDKTIWLRIFKEAPEFKSMPYTVLTTEVEVLSDGQHQIRVSLLSGKTVWTATRINYLMDTESWNVIYYGEGFKKLFNTASPLVITKMDTPVPAQENWLSWENALTNTVQASHAGLAASLKDLDFKAMELKVAAQSNSEDWITPKVETPEHVMKFKKAWDEQVNSVKDQWKTPVFHDHDYDTTELKIQAKFAMEEPKQKKQESHCANPELDDLGF